MNPARAPALRVRLLVAAVVLLLVGCENAVEDMYDQPKHKPLDDSALWSDGRADRPQVPGTLAHSTGTLAGTTSGVRGAGAPPQEAAYTRAALQRGRDRYQIFCEPCHGIAGDGAGYIVERGFPAPPNYRSDRVMQLSDADVYAVITHGYGAMYPYGDRIPPSDRWAIVAYVRVLQRAFRATLADVPAPQRAALTAAARPRG